MLEFQTRFVWPLVWSFSVVWASACASQPKKEAMAVPADQVVLGLKPLSVNGPVELKLSTEAGRTEKVQWLSRTASESFEKGAVRSQETKEATFRVETHILRGDSVSGRVTQAIRTADKAGDLNLHDLALPEPGEVLQMILAPNGDVLRAGNYPPNSLFYIPPVSLPPGPVEVGDTWTIQRSWNGPSDGTPFEMELVSILKGFVACGNDECADIEMSAEVSLPKSLRDLVGFTNRWRGRLLFARKAGSVIWSRVDSLETLKADNVERKVQSCLEAVLTEPSELKPPTIAAHECAGLQTVPL